MAQNQEFKIFSPSEDGSIAELSKTWADAELWIYDLHSVIWALALRDEEGRLTDEEFGILIQRIRREAVEARKKTIKPAAYRWARRFLKELVERWPALTTRIEEQARKSSLETVMPARRLRIRGSESGQLAASIGEILDAASSVYRTWRRRQKQVVSRLRKKLDVFRDFMLHAVPQLTPREVQAWLALWTTERKGISPISVRRIARYCGVSPTTAYVALRGLRAKELITKIDRRTDKGVCFAHGIAALAQKSRTRDSGLKQAKNEEQGQKFRRIGERIVGSPVMWVKFLSKFARNDMRNLHALDTVIWLKVACNVMNGSPRISYARLASGQKKCMQTIVNSVGRLVERGYMTVLEKGGPRRATKYTVASGMRCRRGRAP